MATLEVRTQTELDKAIKNKKPGDIIVCLGGTSARPLEVYGSASVWAYGSASVWAYGSASVRAYGSASVWAYGSASVRASGSASVRAYGSASVWAYGSASVRASGSASVWASGSASVWAYGSASVVASGSASVRASKYVAVHRHNKTAKVKGGVLIDVPDPATLSPADWCDYYGVTVKRGIAILYKAVDDDFSTAYARRHGIFYTPGSKPRCDDFNTRQVCGGGIHASPSPGMAAGYNGGATRFVAVPVKVAEMVVVDDKVKVPRVAGAVYEVDRFGEAVS